MVLIMCVWTFLINYATFLSGLRFNVIPWHLLFYSVLLNCSKENNILRKQQMGLLFLLLFTGFTCLILCTCFSSFFNGDKYVWHISLYVLCHLCWVQNMMADYPVWPQNDIADLSCFFFFYIVSFSISIGENRHMKPLGKWHRTKTNKTKQNYTEN